MGNYGTKRRSFLISEMEASGQLHATTDLPRGKAPQYAMTRWLSGSQRQPGLFVRKSITPAVNETTISWPFFR
jgi:hypothetical protein